MSVTSTAPERGRAARRSARPARLRFSPWLLLPLGLALAAAGYLAWRTVGAGTTAAPAPTAEVTRGTLTISVTGSGTVQPAQTRDLSFPISGQVAEVLVETGDVVEAGQPLARLDVEELELQLRQSEAELKSAEARLAAANGEGATPQDVASAQAQLRSAQATLDALLNPSAAKVADAEAAIAQAESNLQRSRDDASAAKTRADLDLRKAVETLTQAQARYATAKANWDYVQGTGNDPLQPSRTDSQGRSVDNELSDAQQRQYADSFTEAESSLRSAELALKQAQLAYDNARQSEVAAVRDAEAQLAAAQRVLGALKSPDASEVTKARASVEQARVSLERLSAPAGRADLASAEAGLMQAQVQLETAKRAIGQATLTAPFSGVVAAVNVAAGDSAGSSAAALTLIDTSTMYIDASLSESDVGRIEPGQPVALTFDALPDLEVEGEVKSVAPTATVQQNVVTYLVRVSFDPGDASIRPGMTATGAIEVERLADVLLAPSRAVQTQGGAQVVQVRSDPGEPAVVVRVETGASGDGQTVILGCVDTGGQCLQEGDQLVISSTTAQRSTTQSPGAFGGPGIPLGPGR